MGSSSSKKPEITITSIRSSTQDIRSSLREKQVSLQTKENLHQTLVDNSKKLDTLRSKQSKKKRLEIDQLQKLLTDVSEELLEYNDDHLDKGTDESHSFIQVDPQQLKQQKKNVSKVPKGKTNLENKRISPNSINNLVEIEQKLSKVKNDTLVGLKNEDRKLLLLQKKKIEMLSTDLELITIPESSELHDKKRNLEKDLYRYYQKIIRNEKSQARLSKVNPVENDEETDKIKMNSSKLHSIEIMIEDVHDILQNTAKGDDRGDIKALRDEVKKIEAQLSQIEDNSKDNLKSKTILLKKIEQTKKHIDDTQKKKEMNDLDEIMEEIDKMKVEVVNESNSDKLRSMKNIMECRKKLNNLKVSFHDNEVFKEEYLDELDRFLEGVDPNHDGVIMRHKKLKSSKSLEDIIHLQQEWNSLEKNMSVTKLDEVKKVDKLLEKFEESIRAKRECLAGLLTEDNRRKSAEVIRTSAKIYELPKIHTTKSKENFKEAVNEDSITPLKYGTIEHALEEMAKISDRVEEIGKEILTFKGISEDLEYNFFRASLIDKRQIIQNLVHRSSWNQVDAYKVKILEKISYYEDYLKYKLNQNILEMNLNEKLNQIDAKIRRFTGSYHDLLFNRIDKELSNCLKDAEYIDLTEKSERLKQKANYLKHILKERSHFSSVLKQDENLTDTKKIIAESKEYIQKLKNRVENASVLDLSESSIIEECLLSKTLELINLNLKNDTPMFQDVKKILEDLEHCKNILKLKRRSQIVEKTETFEDIELILIKIQTEILDFDALVTDPKFLDLNKNLNDLEIKLRKLEETEGNQGKTLELSLRINLLKTQLDQLALDSEKMFNLENRVREIMEMISENISERNFDELDEELIGLRIQLEKFDVSEKLSYRKITCLNYIEYLLKKMNEKHNRRFGSVSGSVIV